MTDSPTISVTPPHSLEYEFPKGGSTPNGCVTPNGMLTSKSTPTTVLLSPSYLQSTCQCNQSIKVIILTIRLFLSLYGINSPIMLNLHSSDRQYTTHINIPTQNKLPSLKFNFTRSRRTYKDDALFQKLNYKYVVK